MVWIWAQPFAHLPHRDHRNKMRAISTMTRLRDLGKWGNKFCRVDCYYRRDSKCLEICSIDRMLFRKRFKLSLTLLPLCLQGWWVVATLPTHTYYDVLPHPARDERSSSMWRTQLSKRYLFWKYWYLCRNLCGNRRNLVWAERVSTEHSIIGLQYKESRKKRKMQGEQWKGEVGEIIKKRI